MMNQIQKIKAKYAAEEAREMYTLLTTLRPRMEENVQARRRRERRAWAEGAYLTKTGQVFRVV